MWAARMFPVGIHDANCAVANLKLLRREGGCKHADAASKENGTNK